MSLLTIDPARLPDSDADLQALAARLAARIMASKPKPQAPAPEAPKPQRDGPVTHYKYPLLLAAAKAGVDGIALVGPAGTGKTTAARMAAETLSRPFEAVSFGPNTSKSDLFGFIDAGGTYRDTGLVRAAKAGGVFLGDELDAGHPGVSVGLNMVLANPVFATPTGMVQKHRDFVGIVGMNTYGTGANRQYVGRNQLDAATLDRFVVIEWELDPALEASMVGVKDYPQTRLDIGQWGGLSNREWLARVQSVRAAIDSLGIRHIISPRATLNGSKLLAQGVGRYWVERMALWKGLDTDSIAKVERNIKGL